MKHYPHHIGDFDRATRHLTRVERSIYRDLIELYYDTEQPLTLDRAVLCRRILARSNEEVTAVEQTLNEFFTETSTGWFHSRCDEEISKYRSLNTQKSQAGKASAAKKALKQQQALNASSTTVEQALNASSTTVEQTLNGTSTNQEPRTKNQEPDSKEAKKTGTRLPVDWKLTPELESEAIRARADACLPAVDIRTEAEKFRDYWHSQPGAKGVKLDWLATWRNWIRQARGGMNGSSYSAPVQAVDGLAKPNRKYTGLATVDYSEGLDAQGRF